MPPHHVEKRVQNLALGQHEDRLSYPPAADRGQTVQVPCKFDGVPAHQPGLGRILVIVGVLSVIPRQPVLYGVRQRTPAA